MNKEQKSSDLGTLPEIAALGHSRGGLFRPPLTESFPAVADR
jgi:hypothetical protein